MNSPSSLSVSRRQAIFGFFGVLLGLCLPALERQRTARKVLLNRIHVAGFQYHEGMQCREAIRPGGTLELVAEPDNPHDHYAVALYFRRRHIGYVPRDENKHLSRLLREGIPLVSVVTHSVPDAVPWEAVRADVYLMV